MKQGVRCPRGPISQSGLGQEVSSLACELGEFRALAS